jgi:hypothetical protein
MAYGRGLPLPGSEAHGACGRARIHRSTDAPVARAGQAPPLRHLLSPDAPRDARVQLVGASLRACAMPSATFFPRCASSARVAA